MNSSKNGGMSAKKILSIADALIEAAGSERLLANARKTQPRLDESDVFMEVTYNLSQLVSPKTIDIGGVALIYKIEGSHPGGRVQVGQGGIAPIMQPGARMMAPFKPGSVVVSLAPGSATEGYAKFIVIRRFGYDYSEPDMSIQDSSPEVLLGGVKSTGNPTFVTYTVNTVPNTTPVSQTGAFNASGYKRIRTIIDGSFGGNVVTSFDMVPWTNQSPNSGGSTWQEQGVAAMSIPDSRITAYRYRSAVWEVSGNGYMYFQFASVLGTPGAPTSLGICVQGIEK